MNSNQVIADEVLNEVEIALRQGKHWIAYNNSLYFIDKNDMQFFDNETSANEFAKNNISDYDNYTVMHVSSVADVLRKVPYRESLDNQITEPDSNGLYNTDGNAFTDAYIDHIEQQQYLISKNKNGMQILSEDIMGVSDSLHSANKNNLWFAFESSLTSLKAKDITFFESEKEAKDFNKEQNKAGESFHLLPIETTWHSIEESVFINFFEGHPSAPVELNISEILNTQQQINFNYMAANLEEAMQRFDWKHTFYDPQEPNIKALLDDLKEVHHSSQQGKELVENLTLKYWSGYPIEEQKQYLLNQKTNVMNEENVKYLKDNIKYMGFGENLNEQLENNLKQGKDDFKLDFKAVVNNKPFDATLHFGKSTSTDKYFFNSFDASLQKGNGEKVDQTFYLNKGKGITAKEAYNLLDGRAVHKELTNKENIPYKAWVQLDFENKDKHNNFEVKQFHTNYGFDLKEAVGKYAIAELKDPEKEKSLMQSLQKGNLQSVTIEKDGNTHKMFIEANPQFKSMTLYDGQMKRVQKESIEQYKSVSQSQGKDVKKEQKQEVKEDVNKDNKQKASKEIDKPKQTKNSSKTHSVSR